MLDNSYSAAVVTFKRPDSLAVVLEALVHQTHPPTLIVVADNDPDESARSVVSNADDTTVPISYVPVGTNLGPAGGWAAAVEFAQNQPNRGSWVGVFDDDDPLEDSDVMWLLSTRAADACHTQRLAGVGLRGAVLSRSRVRLKRVLPRDNDLASVDYLASNGAPLYRWDALEEVGFFDPDFFFGFEDLDQGLRLQSAGWKVCALGQSLQVVADTNADRVAWREYYKSRALVVISLRHLNVVALGFFVLRSIVAGSVLLAIRHRSLGLARARLAGAFDGVRGALGARRYQPVSNPPKVGSVG